MATETAVYRGNGFQMRKTWDATTAAESATRAGGYTKRTKTKLERYLNSEYKPVEQCGQVKKYR